MTEFAEGQQPEKLKRGEGVGRFLGEHVLLPALDILSNRVEQFHITSVGLENLSEAKNRSCLFVCNHLKPVSAISKQSQLSPDAFVLQHVVEQATGVSPKIIAKAGDGWWSKNEWYRAFQEKSLPIIRELMTSAGLLPINKNPGTSNIDFFHEARKVKNDGDSMVIFPEGNWYSDFSVDHPLSEGAALLAKKYDLPIIPVYIKNANDWKRGQVVYISFGEPFEAVGEGKEGRHQTTEVIRSKIAELQANHS